MTVTYNGIVTEVHNLDDILHLIKAAPIHADSLRCSNCGELKNFLFYPKDPIFNNKPVCSDCNDGLNDSQQ